MFDASVMGEYVNHITLYYVVAKHAITVLSAIIDGSVCVSKGGRYDDLVDKFREGFKVCKPLCTYVIIYTVCMYISVVLLHMHTYIKFNIFLLIQIFEVFSHSRSLVLGSHLMYLQLLT